VRPNPFVLARKFDCVSALIKILSETCVKSNLLWTSKLFHLSCYPAARKNAAKNCSFHQYVLKVVFEFTVQSLRCLLNLSHFIGI
jgi:hypothetical protein